MAYSSNVAPGLRGLFIIDPNGVFAISGRTQLKRGVAAAMKILRVLDDYRAAAYVRPSEVLVSPPLDIVDQLAPPGDWPVSSGILIGSGAFGVVYALADLVLDRTVALKVLRPDNVARDRVLAEARAAAALNHPNVCTVHAIDDSHGALMIVMEYVAGETLASDDSVAARLRPTLWLRLAGRFAAGLAAAHAAGVVHGD